jgi:hypothetical protein
LTAILLAQSRLTAFDLDPIILAAAKHVSQWSEEIAACPENFMIIKIRQTSTIIDNYRSLLHL